MIQFLVDGIIAEDSESVLITGPDHQIPFKLIRQLTDCPRAVKTNHPGNNYVLYVMRSGFEGFFL